MLGGMTLLGDEVRHSGFPKNRDAAISLAAQGLSYARTGNWVGCVKSTVCQWLRKASLTAPELLPTGTLELDSLRTRTRQGRTELKLIRAAAAGMVLGAFGSWPEGGGTAGCRPLARPAGRPAGVIPTPKQGQHSIPFRVHAPAANAPRVPTTLAKAWCAGQGMTNV